MNDVQLLGQPKKPNDRPGAIQSPTGRPGQRGTALSSDSGPPLRLEGLAKVDRRSSPTLARLSDWKAWPRTNGARFRLWPVSSSGRPGQGGPTLASDSGPPLRLEGLASSPPTPALASDSSPPLRPEGLAKEERRSFLSPPTLACLSNQKAWPRRNDARLQLQPTSSISRPGQFASDSDARF